MQKSKPSELDVMARHYLIACIWADCPEGTHPRATAEAMQAAREDCEAFLATVGPDRMQQVRHAYTDNGYGRHQDCGTVHPYMAAMGHDFYLSRQGHGAGFFDRDTLPEALRDFLQEKAREAGEIYPEFYRGWLYIR